MREFVVAKRRWEDDRRRDIHLAWQCVRIYVMSHKKDRIQLPPLDRLLVVPKRVQSVDELEAVVRGLSAQTGFPLRTVAAL